MQVLKGHGLKTYEQRSLKERPWLGLRRTAILFWVYGVLVENKTIETLILMVGKPLALAVLSLPVSKKECA